MHIVSFVREAVLKKCGRTVLIVKISLPKINAESESEKAAAEKMNRFYEAVCREYVSAARSALETRGDAWVEEGSNPLRMTVSFALENIAGKKEKFNKKLVVKRKTVMKKSGATIKEAEYKDVFKIADGRLVK